MPITNKEALNRAYEMTDLGELSWILGMHVSHSHNEGWIAISQTKYSQEILERFGKSSIQPISTPTLANEHLKKLDVAEFEAKPYQSALGVLMYPMLGTCPDLAYAIAALGAHGHTWEQPSTCT